MKDLSSYKTLGMIRFLFSTVIALLTSIGMYAQDQIILENGRVIKGKVLSSQPGLITYQPEGSDSVVVLNKSLIAVILYENGPSEIMSKNKSKGKNTSIGAYPENRISMDWLSFAGREVSFQYERSVGNGNLALRIPVGFVYNTKEFNYILGGGRRYWEIDYAYSPNQFLVIQDENGRGFRTGVSLVAYLNDAKKLRAYLAPGIVTGVFSTSIKYDIVKFNPITGEETSRERREESNRAAFLGTDVMLGFNYLATPHLSMAFETGGGYGTFFPDLGNRSASGIWRMSLLIGYNWYRK
jgi:hypothetical protein